MVGAERGIRGEHSRYRRPFRTGSGSLAVSLRGIVDCLASSGRKLCKLVVLSCRCGQEDPTSCFMAANSACIDHASASSRFTSGICDIVIRMSGNAFCSCCLTVSCGIPVRETVRESSKAGESPDVRFQAPSGKVAPLASGHFVEVVEFTYGEVQRRMATSLAAGAKFPSRSSTSYAAITASIGTPSSTGQRCAYRAPATNEVGHLAKTLGAFLFARCPEGALRCQSGGQTRSASDAWIARKHWVFDRE